MGRWGDGEDGEAGGAGEAGGDGTSVVGAGFTLDLGIKISTLNSFYQCCLVRFRPKLREYVIVN
ncbi:hypothetical protein [Coleofasciculus sp.]|uniref:hypothetical protein n=1 Tax=Coleofasciculus sp. TaxID=3100458 RepID=UPI003A1B2643